MEPNFRADIEAIVDILKPVRQAIDTVQGDHAILSDLSQALLGVNQSLLSTARYPTCLTSGLLDEIALNRLYCTDVTKSVFQPVHVRHGIWLWHLSFYPQAAHHRLGASFGVNLNSFACWQAMAAIADPSVIIPEDNRRHIEAWANDFLSTYLTAKGKTRAEVRLALASFSKWTEMRDRYVSY